MFAVSARHTNAGAARVLAERRRAEQERKRKEMEEREARRRLKLEAIEAERQKLAEMEAAIMKYRVAAFYQTNNNGDRFHGTMDVIIDAVAKVHGVHPSEIKGRARKWTQARFDAIAAIRYLKPSCSMPMIGKKVGGRDHTTIIHALTKRGWICQKAYWEGGRPQFSNADVLALVVSMENGTWGQDESTNESGEDQGQAGPATA